MAIFNTVYGGGYKTFTISWEEKSDMSSGWTYSDSAAWLTAGSSAFDDFFWYYPCLVNSSWVETAKLSPNDFSKDTDWNSVNITSGDNVMIAFPRRWIKLSKSWSIVTLSITNGENKSWFTYYAHSRWTFDNIVSKDIFYLWAYKWYVNNNILKSWSWKTPTWNKNMWNFISYARANDSNSWDAWYEITWFYQYSFIQALYMMKYGNPNSQSVIWQWYYWLWQTTWYNNTLWMNGVSNNRVKLFWLEDFWWNLCEWQWGYCVSSSTIYTALSWFVGNVKTTSPYQSTWKSCWWWTVMASINGTELSMFTASSWNSTANTYYCDTFSPTTGWIVNHWWANHWDAVWIFFAQNGFNSSNAFNDIWARLMYL